MQKSYHYIGLLKAIMRLSLTTLKGADAKEVASSVTAIANEKIKAEKELNAGKKKTGGTLIIFCEPLISGGNVFTKYVSICFPQVPRRNNCMLINLMILWLIIHMMVMMSMISCEQTF